MVGTDPEKAAATADRMVTAYTKAYEHELGRMPKARRVALAEALIAFAVDAGDGGHYAAAVADALSTAGDAHPA
jgi:hypothetical protein